MSNGWLNEQPSNASLDQAVEEERQEEEDDDNVEDEDILVQPPLPAPMPRKPKGGPPVSDPVPDFVETKVSPGQRIFTFLMRAMVAFVTYVVSSVCNTRKTMTPSRATKVSDPPSCTRSAVCAS